MQELPPGWCNGAAAERVLQATDEVNADGDCFTTAAATLQDAWVRCDLAVQVQGDLEVRLA